MIRRVKDFCKPSSVNGRCRPGQFRHHGRAGRAVETGHNRLIFMGVVFLFAFAIITFRLVDLTVIRPGAVGHHAKSDHTAATNNRRANIVDRNGTLLATSVTAYSIFADAKGVVDARQTALRLVQIFPELNYRSLYKKLQSKRRFIWLRRHATPAAYQRTIAAGLAGISARKEYRRTYPHGSAVAHLVGYTGVDNRGMSGIEAGLDVRLRRTPKRLALSIDMHAQAAVREILAKGIRDYRAIGGSAMVLDVRTGEIAAMVSLPDFDPLKAATASSIKRFNRNTLGVYEMGSTFKIFNTAMALDGGYVRSTDLYNVRHPLKISRFTIRDYHTIYRPISVAEIFVKSSNIGSAKIALKLGGKIQKAFLKRYGLLNAPKLEISEVAKPLYPRDWKKINTITISFGHGIAVTPLQISVAVAGIANDGILTPPTLLKRGDGPIKGRHRIVSSETSRIMLQLMRKVVERGTGRRANAPGYLVGGKTGTAEKPGKRGYRRKSLLSSFMAVYPVDAPRYVVHVALDEPKGNKSTYFKATAGLVAAPLAKQIILRTGPILGVMPKLDEEPAKKETWIARRDAPDRRKPDHKFLQVAQ